ncbi:VOC family protein [Lysobacter korlensis]|uniref:VOC family protein n=1 Tax=Lysobacter korlensis TaxID=553636 RepID=A0ABV6RXQ6_9GAMM
MESHIDTITLAVADLDRALAFYRDGLGLPTSGIIGEEFPGSDTAPAGRAAMFQLGNGVILSLYPAAELAKDAGLSPSDVAGHGFSIGHTVSTSQEVDDLLAAAEAAGGRVVGDVGERPWGIYSGYFIDPDGHLWEIVHFLRTPA